MNAPRKFLLLDDQLAKEPEGSGPSRVSFLQSIDGHADDFSFCTGWDPVRHRYSEEVALDFVEREDPERSVLLLDMVFGEQLHFGMELLPRLRAKFPGLPIVVVTANRPENNGRAFLQAGAVDYLIKPLDIRRFWQTVQRYAALDSNEWLLGQHDLYQGAVNTAASLAESGRNLVIQGGSPTARLAFGRFAARCSRRGPAVTFDASTSTADALSRQFFGRRIRPWDSNLTPESGSALANSENGVLHLIGVNSLPRDLQTSLVYVLKNQQAAGGSCGPLVIADCEDGLARLVQEDRFERELFDLLNGNQMVSIPKTISRPEDIMLILATGGASRTEANLAFDEEDEAALDEALQIVPTARFNAWVADAAALARKTRGQRLGKALRLATAQMMESESMKILPTFTAESLEDHAGEFLVSLRLRELSLLVTAYELANGNRAKAASLVKRTNDGRTSTIHFDRWFEQLWKRLPSDKQDELLRHNHLIGQIRGALNRA